MKPIKVQVEVKENWAKQKYALFYTKDYNIAELDYPSKDREKARVYPMAEKKFVDFSCVPKPLAKLSFSTRDIM